MRPTKAVILDLDGLIVDSEPLHQRAFELVLARYGVDHRFTVEEYARFCVGVPVKDNARSLVDHFGLKEEPNVVAAGTDVPRAKPAPDVYLRATRDLGVTPAESVAFEDSVSGITAAKDAGLTVIAVPNPYAIYQDLNHADARAASLAR